MHTWYVARLNGISWDPSSENQYAFVYSLVEGADTFESPEPRLRQQGHVLYDYHKRIETTITWQRGKAVKLSKTASNIDRSGFQDTQASFDTLVGGEGNSMQRGRGKRQRQLEDTPKLALDN